MLACLIARKANLHPSQLCSLLPGQLDRSGIDAKFHGDGGWSELEIKANSAQLKLEHRLSLAKMPLTR